MVFVAEHKTTTEKERVGVVKKTGTEVSEKLLEVSQRKFWFMAASLVPHRMTSMETDPIQDSLHWVSSQFEGLG